MTPLRNALLLVWALSLLLSLPALGGNGPSAEAASTAIRGSRTREDGVPRRILRGGSSQSTSPVASGEVRAQSFLEGLRPRLRLSNGDDLLLTRKTHTRTGDHFLFAQSHSGLPVLGAFIAVHLSSSGALRLAVNETRAGLPPVAAPLVTQEDALQRAVRRAGLATQSYHAPASAVLSVTGEGRLVWRVLLPADDPFGDWEVLVDAMNGEALGVHDLVVSAGVEGAGQIFDPNPVVSLQDQSLTDQNDSPSAIPLQAYRPITLHELEPPTGGLYYLRGPNCVIADFELPMTARAASASPDGFVYNRGDDRFEEVSVYYHVDAAIRELRELGFTDILPNPVQCDAHGLNGIDDSHYVPSTGRLAFGDGCVDDGEDAEVIWHELGHAIQNDEVPGWVNTGESGAMGEGFGDFFSAALSETVSNGYGIEQLFDWDRGPVDGCWSGRRVDSTKHYPEDMTGEVHDDGEIWSATLWGIAQAIGRDRALQIVVESHSMVPLGGNFEDGAVAVMLADDALYGGVDIPVILDLFTQRGILNAADFKPAITHIPPMSTEDPIGPYVVTVDVAHYAPIPADSVQIGYRVSGGSFMTAPMLPTGLPDEYAVSLEGAPLGTTFEYSFRATDLAGLTTRLPAAEGSYFTFSIASDSTAPAIVHVPIADAPYGTWPPTLSADVTDSHGVDSVLVSIRVNGADRGVFAVPQIPGTSTFRMAVPLDASQVAPGDIVEYRLRARDASVFSNMSYLPGASQYYSFTVLNAEGRVLVVDDDDYTTSPFLSQDLAAAGFLVTTITPGALSSAMLVGYDFLAWASGKNASPLSHAGARGVVEEYVAEGGRVVIEGGQVGRAALVGVYPSYTPYPSFAANVLHAEKWVLDSSSSVVQFRALPGKSVHPVLYAPNVLPATFTLNQGGTANNMDAVIAATDAMVVADDANWPGSGGVIVYDDDAAPQSGQVVYCAFNIGALSDANVRRNLVSNIGHYLVAKQGTDSSAIQGTVNLAGGGDKSGTIVHALNADLFTLTDSDGRYRLSGLYSTPQLLEISHAGYETVQIMGCTPPENGTLSNTDAELRAVDTFSYGATPYQAIPDNNPAGISSIIDCTMQGTVHDVLVSIVIHHTYIGDLIVKLTSPSGRIVYPHYRTMKGSDNIIATFDTERLPDAGTMNDFDGGPTFGSWTLTVSDNGQVETGTFDSWTLLVTSLRPTNGGPEPGPPAVAALESLAPNPFSSSARLAYTLPHAGPVRLAIYDLTGREIAVIDEGRRDPGRHEIVWNARDREGRRVGAGIYFCRFTAGKTEESRKLVLLQ